jgi:glycerol-3-phosphate dehydrogenase (NAD(P)+)
MSTENSKTNVAIIGVGSIGKAIAGSLDPRCVVALWDKHTGIVPKQGQMAEVIATADVIFLCVPASVARQILRDIRADRKPDALVVTLAKGIEADTGQTIETILAEELPQDSYALLSGPMLAEEMEDGKGAVALVAAENISTYHKISSIFKPEFIKLEYSKDLRSVAYAGVLKNIYAMMLGIIDGLDYGNNIKGYFTGKIIVELAVAAERLGLDKATVGGIPGVDDFVATAFSPYSVNERAGSQLAKGLLPSNSEGFISLPQIITDLKNLDKLDVLKLLEEIVIDHKDPKTAVKDFLYH